MLYYIILCYVISYYIYIKQVYCWQLNSARSQLVSEAGRRGLSGVGIWGFRGLEFRDLGL